MTELYAIGYVLTAQDISDIFDNTNYLIRYNELARLLHPDKATHKDLATKAMVRLNRFRQIIEDLCDEVTDSQGCSSNWIKTVDSKSSVLGSNPSAPAITDIQLRE